MVSLVAPKQAHSKQISKHWMKDPKFLNTLLINLVLYFIVYKSFYFWELERTDSKYTKDYEMSAAGRHRMTRYCCGPSWNLSMSKIRCA